MEEKINNDELEIDFFEILEHLKRSWKLILFSTISMAILVAMYTQYYVIPKYASEATIFLVPKVNELGYVESQQSVISNQNLVNSYVSIIKGDSILEGVVEILGKRASLSQIKGSLSVSNDVETQIIRIRSTTEDPQLSKDIVEGIVNQFTTEMLERLNIQNIAVIDTPKINQSPVSPNIKKKSITGGMMGFGLSCGYVLVKMLLNKRLRNKNEAESYLGIPVLVEIPYYKG